MSSVDYITKYIYNNYINRNMSSVLYNKIHLQ